MASPAFSVPRLAAGGAPQLRVCLLLKIPVKSSRFPRSKALLICTLEMILVDVYMVDVYIWLVDDWLVDDWLVDMVS